MRSGKRLTLAFYRCKWYWQKYWDTCYRMDMKKKHRRLSPYLQIYECFPSRCCCVWGNFDLLIQKNTCEVRGLWCWLTIPGFVHLKGVWWDYRSRLSAFCTPHCLALCADWTAFLKLIPNNWEKLNYYWFISQQFLHICDQECIHKKWTMYLYLQN